MTRRLELTTWTALLLAAYALRLHHLDFESFWIDEADNIHLIAQPWSALLARFALAGDSSPLYWLLLRLWSEIAGQSEYALRFPSVGLSLLTLPLTFSLAHRLLDRQAGWVSAVLIAGNSYLIYYAQEARTYGLFTATFLASTLLLLRAQEGGQAWRWVLFVLSAFLMVESHIFGGLAVLAQLSFLALRMRWHSPRALLTFALVMAPLAVLLVGLRGSLVDLVTPTLPDLWPRLLSQGPDHMLRLLWVWAGFPSVLPKGPAGVAALILFVGAPPPPPSGRRGQGQAKALLFATAFVLLPLACRALLIAVVPRVDDERYVIFVLPAFLLVLAAGLAALASRTGRLLPPLTIALLAVTLYPWTYSHLGDVRLKENWREAVRRASAHLAEGDLALTNDAGALRSAIAYYSKKPLRYLSAQEVPENASEEKIASFFGAFRESGRQLLAASSFGGGITAAMQEWIDQHTLKVGETSMGTLVLTRYRLQPFPLLQPPAVQHTLSLRFGDNVSLFGYDLAPSPAGDETLSVILHWQARGPIAHEYDANLMLADDMGQVWASDISAPTRGFYPMTSWQAGQFLRDERDLPLHPGMPPGVHRLEVALYRRPDGEVLPLVDAAGAPLAAVTTLGRLPLTPRWLGTPPPPDSVALDVQPSRGPRLVGARLPGAGVRPGSKLSIVTYWRLGAGARPGQSFQLELRGPTGDLYPLSPQPIPAAAADPPGTDGELRARPPTHLLPPSLTAGRYSVFLRLLDAAGEAVPLQQGWWPMARTSVALGTLDVLDPPPAASLPSGARAFEASWDEGIRLRGVQVASRLAGGPPGERLLEVDLYWEAGRTPARSYTIFVHLLDEEGRLVAQHDGLPARGEAPTSGWMPGRLVRDAHIIPLPDDLPPAGYRLVVGLYARETGNRLSRVDGADSLQVAVVNLP